jgi:hypothetical protein
METSRNNSVLLDSLLREILCSSKIIETEADIRIKVVVILIERKNGIGTD